MGQSTDAILLYGVALPAEEDEDKWPKWLHEDSLDAEAEETIDDAITVRLIEAGLRTERYSDEGAKVQLVTHCSCEYPMYVLAAKEIRSYRGDVTLVTPQMFAVQPEWDAYLAKALEVLELSLDDEQPGWLLVSNWC